MAKAKTNFQFIEELKGINTNIEPLEEYINSQTKILVMCKICGNKWRVVPNSLLRDHGCPVCSKKKQNNDMSIINEDDYDKVIDLYLNTNTPIIRIANKFGAKSKDSVYRVLHECGIDKDVDRHSYRCFVDSNTVNKIYHMYVNEHMSKRQIVDKLEVSYVVVNQTLDKLNVEIRKHYAHSFNENYFDKIDTHNKAYLLGFLYADGCVNKNNVVSIVVHKKDREILEAFVNELDATNTIDSVKIKPHLRVSFCSKHMCDSLKKLGCGCQKTFNLQFPTIEDKFKYDFIRGFMDGDGCISVSNRGVHKYIYLSFVGTLDMMTALKDIFGVDNKIYTQNSIYALHIGKTKDVIRILKNIYADAELYLSRKHNKYKDFIEWHESR